MAPRIFTLLRSPVTETPGGQPTRRQVACRVESCRKLASSVKISAQCRAWAFFEGSDRCAGASGPAPRHRRGPECGVDVAPKTPRHGATCAHGRGDTGRRTPPRSPRRSWAMSRCRCPDRKLLDHCAEYLPTVVFAFPSVLMADPTDGLPADRPLHRSDSAGATRTPSIAVP